MRTIAPVMTLEGRTVKQADLSMKREMMDVTNLMILLAAMKVDISPVVKNILQNPLVNYCMKTRVTIVLIILMLSDA
jgi:hypothetical protein